MLPSLRLPIATALLWCLQLAILNLQWPPSAVLAFLAPLVMLAPKTLRLIAVLVTLGVAGWLLPTNQTSLVSFESPDKAEQLFRVISNQQNWGASYRYWISLAEQSDRIGYLEIDEPAELEVGASYVARLNLMPKTQLERAGFVARIDGEYELHGEPSSWQQQISELRANFRQRLSGPSADSKALVLGLTIGDRSALSNELSYAMRELSLSHIVAVSGANPRRRRPPA